MQAASQSIDVPNLRSRNMRSRAERCATSSTTFSRTSRSTRPRRRGARCGRSCASGSTSTVERRAGEGGFALALDGRPVKTPARRPLAAPARGARRGAGRRMARAARGHRPGDHAADAARQLDHRRRRRRARAGGGGGREISRAPISCSIARDARRAGRAPGAAWDPVIAWAREALGARFVLARGHVRSWRSRRRRSPPRAPRSRAMRTATILGGSARCIRSRR